MATVGEGDTRPGVRDALAAFQHRNFRVFWIGALLSNTGSWLQNTTIPFVVYGLTGSAAWVGAMAAFQFVPVVLMGPLGGALADRYPRRSVLLVTQSAAAVLALAFWLTWVTDRLTMPALIGLVLVSGVVAGLNIPSWQAFVSELVPRESLLNAVTLNSLQFNAARAFGPALAGIVLGWGVGWAFVLNALSYLAVLVALALVRVPRLERSPREGSVLADFVAAARATGDLPGVRVCFLAVTALGVLGGPLFQFLVVFAKEVFGVDDGMYGLLGAALGIGAIVAAPYVAGRGTGMPRSTLLTGAMVLYGAAIAVFALSPWFALAVAVLAVAGGGYLAIASTLNTTIQLQVPEVMRGKVLSLYIMLLTAAVPVGSLIQGRLVETFGPRPVVATAGVLFAVMGMWLRVDGTRRAAIDADRQPEAGQPA